MYVETFITSCQCKSEYVDTDNITWSDQRKNVQIYIDSLYSGTYEIFILY
jgi:hypothetical protein